MTSLLGPSMAVAACVNHLESDKSLWQAKIILDAKTRVKVTARRYKGKRSKRSGEYVVTIGPYDYEDRMRRSDREWGPVYVKPTSGGKRVRR